MQRSSFLSVCFTLLLTSTLTNARFTPRKLLQEQCDVRNMSSCVGARVCAPVFSAEAVCVAPPVGGAIISTNEDILPTPLVYFPLSTNPVESWPSRTHNGTVDGAVLVSDPDFGSVFRCLRGDKITLSNTSFAQAGTFTVNLWIKLPVELLANRAEQSRYIFSTSSSTRRFNPNRSNQVHLILSYADEVTLRAHVRDGSDEEQVEMETEAEVDVADGSWHMITVSAALETPKGVRLFVDGEKVSETEESGGDEMELSGEVFLCSRFDSNRKTYFDGYITQLSIFSTSLSEEQIEELYSTTHRAVFERDSSRRRRDEVVYVRGSEVDSGLAGQPEDLMLTNKNTPSGFNYTLFIEEDLEFCESEDSNCPRRSICARVHDSLLEFLKQGSSTSLDSEEDGICVRRRNYIMDGSQEIPIAVPLAYFPLKDGRLDSWPVGNYRGYTVATEFEEDDIFGTVFSCRSQKSSLIVLENIPYGEKGSFSINFWFRSTELDGATFQYLLSHGDFTPTPNSWSQNQVQVLIPETDHAASGVLRVVIKDSNDNETEAIFLDSDGEIGELFMKDEDSVSEQLVQPANGAWHMVSLVAGESDEDGFSLYLDSQLVGNITSDDIEMPPGGDALRPGGKIYLCGRNDAASNRYFDGQITELAFFDQDLTRRQIRALYNKAIDLFPELQSSTD